MIDMYIKCYIRSHRDIKEAIVHQMMYCEYAKCGPPCRHHAALRLIIRNWVSSGWGHYLSSTSITRNEETNVVVLLYTTIKREIYEQHIHTYIILL